MDKNQFIKNKQQNREKKRLSKRSINAEEVIFIFEKYLENWKPIRIYNTIIQNNPDSKITKKHTEQIVTGNCKVYESEISKERYDYYLQLREKVYKYQDL